MKVDNDIDSVFRPSVAIQLNAKFLDVCATAALVIQGGSCCLYAAIFDGYAYLTFPLAAAISGRSSPPSEVYTPLTLRHSA